MVSRSAAGARMVAWRLHAYGGTHELRLEAARVPALRAPDELLVRVRAASLNPLDVAMTRGYGASVLNALRALDGGAAGVEFPLVCGRDFVGDVERAAAGADARLRRGARVWGVVPPHRAGTHAQYVRVRERWVSLAPTTLSDVECGGAPYTALTACAALRAAGRGATRGARVLVLGLGGVGQAAVQLLAARGAHAVAVCAPEQHALALQLGAVAALDRQELVGEGEGAGGPYAAVLDCAGLGGQEAAARRWRSARYVTLTSPLLRETDARGLFAGAARAACTLFAHNWQAAATGAGAAGGACPPQVRWAFFAPRGDDLEEIRRLAELGRFRVCVQQVFPWWEGDAAYARAAVPPARGKLVLDWSRERDVPAPANA